MHNNKFKSVKTGYIILTLKTSSLLNLTHTPRFMNNKKIIIEHELRSKSPNIIWSLLSSPEGLAKWIADEVVTDGEQYKFTWGDVAGNHEVRLAEILEKKDCDHIRFRWCDEDHENTYWELRMEKSDLTGSYVLIITDFAVDGDADTIEDIWDANLDNLHTSSGL